MGKLFLKDKLCILTSWALVLMSGAAEQDYFPQERSLTWEEARSYCQVCFDDLVTLTSENTQSIAVNLTSDYWVGLRKNLTRGSAMFWSRWANGAPLAFQNWYPGWPVLEPPSPEPVCCSCSCTCPARPSSTTYWPTLSGVTSTISGMTDSTDLSMTTETATDATATVTDATATATDATATDATATATDETATDETTTGGTATGPLVSDCVRSPMLSPNVSKADQNYIEDSCVAMLSFGAWVEKNCSERLPFICYEVHFVGRVEASRVTTRSAIISWERGPGRIDHYRLEIRGDTEWKENQTGLTSTLGNLTAGTRYSVRVFPVKCQRDLNPQTAVFFTVPNKVENLKADNRTESSVTLSWGTPSGNVNFYVVKVDGRLYSDVTANSIEVKKLTPGSLYTFSVLSAVDDKTKRSEESNITVYTKPGTASNLKVFNNSDTSLKLSWNPPSGIYADFRVTAVSSNTVYFNETETETHADVTNLPVGSRITLSVTARASSGLKGNSVSTVGYTTPGPISNLALVPTGDSINATWNFPAGTEPSFKITLQLNGKVVETRSTETPTTLFKELKNSANYTVVVRITNEEGEGPPVSKFTYTFPAPPRNLKVASADKHQITFKWEPPINASTVKYNVTLSSRFWGHSFSAMVDKETKKFDQLNSGTRYEFEVRTMVGSEQSTPEKLSQYTVAEKREISLAMLCSSAEVLLCDNATTRERVFVQLRAHFKQKLQDDIFWELQKPD